MTTTTRTLRIPHRLHKRPRDKHGHVVPYFVAYIDGVPDFRVMDGRAMHDCDQFQLCWVCGTQRGRYGTFVIGPMCTVNRVSAEPPSHRECAEYAAQACPFLTVPHMTRRENRMPDGTVLPAGEMIKRNPGVTALWTSRTWKRFNVEDGHLYDIGEPTAVTWWREGRPATRPEVEESIESGYPTLLGMAEEEGLGAVVALERMALDALQYLPAS